MSIGKRFALFLSTATAISVIMLITMLSKVIAVSPAINNSIDATTETISSQFVAMGYTADDWGLSRPDPQGHQDSYVKLWFTNEGLLEKVTCDTAYVNTRSAAEIYADMEKSAEILGESLDSQQEEVLDAIEGIRTGGSVRAGGDWNQGGWSVVSSTYNDKQEGKLRYVCFSVWIKPK